MVFHSGGYNSSQKERRAINHVYTIPYFKQQISLPNILEAKKLEPEERDLLGFSFDAPTSVDQFIK
jgi:ectoine hydroxylase-related dioxygenase (phytanoyl-CoA dioxygenase family)